MSSGILAFSSFQSKILNIRNLINVSDKKKEECTWGRVKNVCQEYNNKGVYSIDILLMYQKRK
jgi:hypothetical protein